MSFVVIIKSGLTTISIVIVSISLYPVRDLLSSLKVSRLLPQSITLLNMPLRQERRIF
jgi:hypothetical protein